LATYNASTPAKGVECAAEPAKSAYYCAAERLRAAADNAPMSARPPGGLLGGSIGALGGPRDEAARTTETALFW